MIYQAINWKDRIVEKPNTFETKDNGDNTITLIPDTGQVLQEGTPINAQNLNHIERGLIGAYAQLEEIAVIVDFVKLENETWDKTINRIISEGNKVKFLNKKYDLFDTIILKNNTVLELHEETELIRKHDKQMFMSEFNVNTTLYNGTNGITVKGGTITHNGNNTPRNMFLLFHARNIKFKNVTFKNIVGTHALDLVGCENIMIDECNFLGYDHTVSNEKFREVIQIDVAGQTGAGLDINKYPNTSLCFDGTRTRNVTIKNCLFDKSETLPPPHNCIGTHSQVEKPLNGDNRSNNIRILNNTFIGNGIVTTSKDDGNISKAGKCIRLIQMENVKIIGNTFKNYARSVSCEIFAKYRGLKGEVITDVEEIKKQYVGNNDIFIINNKIDAPNVETGYRWNCISIDSKVSDCRNKNFKIQGNTIYNNGLDDNRSIGIRNLDSCHITNNTINGGQKGIYIEMETSSNIITRDNDYNNVSIPVDFVGAYSQGSGESVVLWEDGTDNKYLVYILNTQLADVKNNPTLRIKSVKTGKTADFLTHINIKNKNGNLTEINPYIDGGCQMPIMEVGQGLKIEGSNNLIKISPEQNIEAKKSVITPKPNERTTINVVFDTPFSTTPVVTATVVSSVIDSTVLECGVSNVTKSGFNLTILRTNSTQTSVNWIAVGQI